MNRFVIIDGHAILHRAFHALPPLTRKDGILVNAVFGFFSMFLKILEDTNPQYLAVCFDRAKPTFRQTMYAGYQAHRPKMSEELGPQIDIVRNILKDIGVQIFEIDGYEADDLIGTLADQSQKSKEDTSDGGRLEQSVSHDSSEVDVVIVSGDRDMLQLVNSHVKVLAPITGITKMILFDGQKVLEKYGIKPTQIIDYKALVGDTSDGYPGVAGIGPKTAGELLNKYGSFEEIYKNLKKLSPKIAGKLAIDAEQAAMAKQLATIVRDAPITLDLNKTSLENLDKRQLKKEFEKFEFKSLINRLKENFSNSNRFSGSVVAGKVLIENKKNATTEAQKKKETQKIGEKKGEQLGLL